MDGSRKWDGVRNDTSDVGDSLTVAKGVSFLVEGELRRRPGLTYLSSFGGSAMFSFRSVVSGPWLLVVTSSGTIEKAAL